MMGGTAMAGAGAGVLVLGAGVGVGAGAGVGAARRDSGTSGAIGPCRSGAGVCGADLGGRRKSRADGGAAASGAARPAAPRRAREIERILSLRTWPGAL